MNDQNSTRQAVGVAFGQHISGSRLLVEATIKAAPNNSEELDLSKA